MAQADSRQPGDTGSVEAGPASKVPEKADFRRIPRARKFSTSIVFEQDAHLALKRYCVENRTNFSEVIHKWILEKCADYMPPK